MMRGWKKGGGTCILDTKTLRFVFFYEYFIVIISVFETEVSNFAFYFLFLCVCWKGDLIPHFSLF